MPIVPHRACVEPPDDTVICRFMDFPKFRDLFASEEIYLRRVDLFKETDPREGLPDDDYVRRARGLQKYVLADELQVNDDQAFNRQHAEGHFINCWQIFEGETIEMWTTYGKGVAIFSTFARLRAAIQDWLDPLNVGVVRYGRKENGNLIECLFTKHRHFTHEKELRILLQCHDPMAGANRHWDIDNIPHYEPLEENKMHEWVHPCKRRRVDLKSLVTEVRMSPWASAAEVDEVWWWVKNKGRLCLIESSHLAVPRTSIPEMT
jgi:hypothetical protein